MNSSTLVRDGCLPGLAALVSVANSATTTRSGSVSVTVVRNGRTFGASGHVVVGAGGTVIVPFTITEDITPFAQITLNPAEDFG